MDTERQMRETSRALSLAVDLQLLSSVGTVEALRTSERLDGDDLSAFYRSAQRVLESQRDTG